MERLKSASSGKEGSHLSATGPHVIQSLAMIKDDPPIFPNLRLGVGQYNQPTFPRASALEVKGGVLYLPQGSFNVT